MFLQQLDNYLKTMKSQIKYNPFVVVSRPAGNECIALKKKRVPHSAQLVSERPASKEHSKAL